MKLPKTSGKNKANNPTKPFAYLPTCLPPFTKKKAKNIKNERYRTYKKKLQ